MPLRTTPAPLTIDQARALLPEADRLEPRPDLVKVPRDFSKAIAFMAANFRAGPSLVDIAATVDLSPFHFHRQFSAQLGISPKQYLTACQIHAAQISLKHGTDLADVAKECGFAHQSHFTSRFKRMTGHTPSRWRRLALAG